MDQPAFGDELRRLRQQRGLSLKKFARLVHYDPGYLSEIENGLKPPTDAIAGRCDAVLDAGGSLSALVAACADSGLSRSKSTTIDLDCVGRWPVRRAGRDRRRGRSGTTTRSHSACCLAPRRGPRMKSSHGSDRMICRSRDDRECAPSSPGTCWSATAADL